MSRFEMKVRGPDPRRSNVMALCDIPSKSCYQIQTIASLPFSISNFPCRDVVVPIEFVRPFAYTVPVSRRARKSVEKCH